LASWPRCRHSSLETTTVDLLAARIVGTIRDRPASPRLLRSDFFPMRRERRGASEAEEGGDVLSEGFEFRALLGRHLALARDTTLFLPPTLEAFDDANRPSIASAKIYQRLARGSRSRLSLSLGFSHFDPKPMLPGSDGSGSTHARRGAGLRGARLRGAAGWRRVSDGSRWRLGRGRSATQRIGERPHQRNTPYSRHADAG
jgi:hypothetical protein